MSEPPPEILDEEALDWASTDFGIEDYVDDRQVTERVVLVADGTQVDSSVRERGWALSPGDGAG